MSFSRRYGFEQAKEIQIYDMDSDLRISLWNVIYKNFNNYAYYTPKFLEESWMKVFKKDLSKFIIYTSDDQFYLFKKEFLRTDWNKVYECIEIVMETNEDVNKNILIRDFNTVLEMENSAYRIIENKVIRITDEIEIEEINKVFSNDNKFKPVKDQIENALILLSDKKNPDYKNSFKESISAVESLCRIILNDKKVTLGDALKKIENDNDLEINGALRSAFSSIYGFASNEVRHGTIKESEIDYNLAKFMVVSCSAFINYLISINKG